MPEPATTGTGRDWKRWSEIGERITPEQDGAFLRLVSQELTPDQAERIARPDLVLPRQEAVLAVHWHPEFVPLELADRRIAATFPGLREELIIPTQHNRVLCRKGLAGVEIDCYSPEFRRKTQLLVHLREQRLAGAGVLLSMIEHTFKYRQSQLEEFLATLLEPVLDMRLQLAAARTGAEQELVDFVRAHALRLRILLERHAAAVPPEALRNKLVRDFFDDLRPAHGDLLVGRAQVLLRAVKNLVKKSFSPEFFFETAAVIEEARGLGAGIVIPHPEQFWPILLADLDVDGIEVWNPQSREYTEFLIKVVDRQNRSRGGRPLLIFMGDDCHLGEKAKEQRHREPEKAGREVGVQPAWEDPAIRKALIAAGAGLERTIHDYRARLL